MIEILMISIPERIGILDMRPEDYFTEERFITAGIDPRKHLVRTSNLWRHNHENDPKTIRDLVALGEYGIANFRKDIGKKTVAIVSKILAHDNIILPHR